MRHSLLAVAAKQSNHYHRQPTPMDYIIRNMKIQSHRQHKPHWIVLHTLHYTTATFCVPCVYVFVYQGRIGMLISSHFENFPGSQFYQRNVFLLLLLTSLSPSDYILFFHTPLAKPSFLLSRHYWIFDVEFNCAPFIHWYGCNSVEAHHMKITPAIDGVRRTR